MRKDIQYWDLALTQTNLLNTIGGGVSQPEVQHTQTDQGIRINMYVPGLDGKAFRVLVAPKEISLFYVVNSESVHENQLILVPMHLQTFPIPASVDKDRIEATSYGSRLEVVMPFKRKNKSYPRLLKVKRK